MQRCWDQDPHLRLEVSEALQVLLTPSVLCSFQYLCIHQFFYPSTSSELPAWKQLISRTSTMDEHISLITMIFVDRDQVEMIMRLSGNDTQTLVDVIDEVRPCILSPPRNEWVDSNPTGDPQYRGRFADVWKGQYNGQDVAVKVLRIYSTHDLQPIKGVGRFKCHSQIVVHTKNCPVSGRYSAKRLSDGGPFTIRTSYHCWAW